MSISDDKKIIMLLKQFRDGYTKRDITILDRFVEELFSQDNDILIIGTSAVYPGGYEWCEGINAVREIIRGDWESWGEVVFDLEQPVIRINNNTAWIALTGTLTKARTSNTSSREDKQHKEILQDKLDPLQIYKNTPDTFIGKNGKENNIFPLRLTAVLVKKENKWKFKQMHFSYAVCISCYE